jgi:hypothetical protein
VARRLLWETTMTTLDPHDLAVVCGGTLDTKAASRPLIPALPRDLPLPKPAAPPGTIPLGPFYPPAPQTNIA